MLLLILFVNNATNAAAAAVVAAAAVPHTLAPGRAADHPEAGAGTVDHVRSARVRAVPGKCGAVLRRTMFRHVAACLVSSGGCGPRSLERHAR